MAVMRVNVFKKKIAEAQPGDTMYMNTINFSVSAVDLLRKFIQDGTLSPVEEELQKSVVPEALPKFLSGECLLPQMTYVRNNIYPRVIK